MNHVTATDAFLERLEELEPVEKKWVEKIRRQLEHDLRVGKPLRFDWFREKKLKGKRLYFVVNEKSGKAALIAFGDKKEQQATIAHVFSRCEQYLSLVR